MFDFVGLDFCPSLKNYSKDLWNKISYSLGTGIEKWLQIFKQYKEGG